MTVSAVLDAAGRRRSPATLPGYHAGRPPRNKGVRYPADPQTVEEIIAVMRQTADDRHGWRLRALIVALWRGGLRVQEVLAAHQLRHAHALELAREGVPLNIIHANSATPTSAPRRSTCKASTPRRSSPPSTPDAPR